MINAYGQPTIVTGLQPGTDVDALAAHYQITPDHVRSIGAWVKEMVAEERRACQSRYLGWFNSLLYMGTTKPNEGQWQLREGRLLLNHLQAAAPKPPMDGFPLGAF